MSLRFGNLEIIPADVEGQSCVFSVTPFTLSRARWIPDNEVIICPLCQQKFNQLRRKHHCRQCGRVLCNKCTEQKILLPQLGYDNEPQKVCDECLPISRLVAKSRSLKFDTKEETSKMLCEMLKDPNMLHKVVELGGVQTLIYLSQSISVAVKERVADGLHMLATHTALHPLLIRSGAIKAVCCILSKSEDADNQEKTLINSISTLLIFCKCKEYKSFVISEGAIKPILDLCGMRETVALLAVMTLSLIADHQDSLYTLIEKENHFLTRIMNLVNSADEKMQEISLKILASLSLGTEWHCHRIVQEHYTNGKCLVLVVNRIPKNQQVLVNGICLIANLATSEQEQSVLRECLDGVCVLMKNKSLNQDVQVQISRCLANFSKYEVNSSTLTQYITDVITTHLQSQHSTTRLHGIKTVINTLTFAKNDVLPHLSKLHYDALIDALVGSQGLTDSIIVRLNTIADERSPPMSL